MNRWIVWIPLLRCIAGCADGGTPSSVGESPTGTFLEPDGELEGAGYRALDETCENTGDENYIQRFVTPMFREVAVQGEVAFLVDGSLLWAVSIADPSAPERLSLTRLPGHPRALAFGPGGRLLVANGERSLLSVEVSNPGAPRVAGEVGNLPGMSLDVAVNGDTAYVACGEGGLVSIDIGVPDAPVAVDSVEIPGFANAVDVEGGLAFVAACAGLCIADVSDPGALEVIETAWMPGGFAKDVDAEDSEVFVAAGDALFAFDVSDPRTAEWIGYYNDRKAAGFYVNAVAVKDGVAFIAAGDESFRAVDTHRMSPPDGYTPPSESGEVSLDETVDKATPDRVFPPGTIRSWPSDPIGIAVDGDLLFVLGNFRWVGERLMIIMDVASPSAMVEVGSYAQPNDIVGVDAVAEGAVVHGAGGRETIVSPKGDTVDAFKLFTTVQKMTATGDALHLLLENGTVYTRRRGTSTRIAASIFDVAEGGDVLFATSYETNQLLSFPFEANGTIGTASGEAGFDDALLGFSRIVWRGAFLHAYDWALGTLHTFEVDAAGEMTHVGVLPAPRCESYDIADFYSGERNDRAGLCPTDEGFALLCPRDENRRSSVIFYGQSASGEPELLDRISLPEGRYADFVVDTNALFAVGFDNNAYRSTLSRFDGVGWSSLSFDGHANRLARVGDEVWVADGDAGVRRFGITEEGFEALGLLDREGR